MNEVIKEYIDTYVKENGNEEITGAILNSTLKKMVSQLYAHRCYGVITPSLPLLYADDIPAWGIASQNGTYTNYGGIEIENELALIVYDGGTFTKQTLPISHTYLSNKNSDDNFLHVTSGQITAWNNKVDGPASSTANTVPVFADETGKLLKESSVKVNGDNMRLQLVTLDATFTVNSVVNRFVQAKPTRGGCIVTGKQIGRAHV